MSTKKPCRWWIGLIPYICLAFSACSDEVTNSEPEAHDFHIYFSYAGDSTGGYMPVYSTASLTAVDSVYLGPANDKELIWDMEFFDGGNQVVMLTDRLPSIVVAKVPTFDTIAHIPLARDDLVISHGGDMVATNGKSNDGPVILSLPGLDTIWADTQVNGRRLVFSPDDKQLIICGYPSGFLRVVSFQESPVIEQTVITSSADGTEPFTAFRLATDSANKRLYAVGRVGGPSDQRYELHVYQFDTFELERGIEIGWGYLRDSPEVSPEGRYVYFCSGVDPQAVARYDATMGIMSTFLVASDLGLAAFQPYDLELTPDGQTLVLMSTPHDTGVFTVSGPGDIYIVDVNSRDLKAQFLNNGGIGRAIWCRP